MYVILLFLVWIAINGRITWEVCVIGAIVSGVVYFFAGRIMPVDDHSGYRITRNPIRIFSYFLYVLGQIIISNPKTLIRLINPFKKVHPVLVFFEIDLKTQVAKTILANSITITPGTVAVFIRDDLMCVHVFDESLSEGLENNGFLRRLRKMEVRK